MIVKNEEKCLPRCLESIKNVADEIIIVDTGSKDNTMSIARDFGAKVYQYAWNDNFSEARNHSLSHASCDWILQIDADEELEQADIPKLRQAMCRTNYNGIIVSIQSVIKGSFHTFFNTRIFRRGKGYYKDIIHEQIVVEGERLPSEIRIYHHGYNLSEDKMQLKWQRTTRLLRKQIEQDASNSFAWFNLIHNYRTQKLFQDGIRAGEAALKCVTPETHLHHAVMIIYETANCYLHNGDFTRAKELCHDILAKLSARNVTPENIDIIFTLACTCLKEGNYREALGYFNRFLALRTWYLNNLHTASLMVDTLGYDYAAYNGLGCCYGKFGQWESAIDCLQRAIATNARYLPPYKNLARCYTCMNNLKEATNALLPAVTKGIADDEIILHVGELYIRQTAYEQAIPYLKTYLKNNPENEAVASNIALCYEKAGHWAALNHDPL